MISASEFLQKRQAIPTVFTDLSSIFQQQASTAVKRALESGCLEIKATFRLTVNSDYIKYVSGASEMLMQRCYGQRDSSVLQTGDEEMKQVYKAILERRLNALKTRVTYPGELLREGVCVLEDAGYAVTELQTTLTDKTLDNREDFSSAQYEVDVSVTFYPATY